MIEATTPTREAPAACLSLDDAASRLSISRRHLERQIARGKLPSVKLGRRVLVRESDLVRFIENVKEVCHA